MIEKVRVSVYITHQETGDIILTLVGPDGTTACVLSDENGFPGVNYGTSAADADRTTFDDAAGAVVYSVPAPFVGTYRPQNPLTVFNGLAATGAWRFNVQDVNATKTGSIQAVSVFITEGGIETRHDATSGLPAAIPDNNWGSPVLSHGATVSIDVAPPPPPVDPAVRSGFSDSIADVLLDHVFQGGTDYAVAYPVYLALLTEQPAADGSMTEAAYAGYARLAIDQADLSSASSRSITNVTDLAFPTVGSEETVVWAVLMDSATVGNPIMGGQLPSAYDLAIGDVPTIQTGDLALSL